MAAAKHASEPPTHPNRSRPRSEIAVGTVTPWPRYRSQSSATECRVYRARSSQQRRRPPQSARSRKSPWRPASVVDLSTERDLQHIEKYRGAIDCPVDAASHQLFAIEFLDDNGRT